MEDNKVYFPVLEESDRGTPLSPLLFCLVEEVLSRGITKLVNTDNLKLIRGNRNAFMPSHIMYVDDVMLFCKANSSNIQALISFIDKYAQISGQIINPKKSTILCGSLFQVRLNSITLSICFAAISLSCT